MSTSATAKRITYNASAVPLWSEANIIASIERAYKSGSHACFAFTRGGKLEQHNNGCFGAMHGYLIENDNGWGVNLKYHSTGSDWEGIPNDHERWFTEKVLLHPKYSPWRHLLARMTIVRNKNGIPVMALLNDDEKVKHVDKGLLQNFNIASRTPFDRSDMVRSMYNMYQSKMVNKREAILLRSIFSVNPVTGAVLADMSADMWTAFLAPPEYLRFLEGVPNSSMAFKGGRHLPINNQMSSDNDRYVWGMDGRARKAVNDQLTKKPPHKKVKTFFGAKVEIMSPVDVKKWVEDFRAAYKEVLKQPAKGQTGVIEYVEEDEDEDDF